MVEAPHFVFDLGKELPAVWVDDLLEPELVLIGFFGD